MSTSPQSPSNPHPMSPLVPGGCQREQGPPHKNGRHAAGKRKEKRESQKSRYPPGVSTGPRPREQQQRQSIAASDRQRAQPLVGLAQACTDGPCNARSAWTAVGLWPLWASMLGAVHTFMLRVSVFWWLSLVEWVCYHCLISYFPRSWLWSCLVALTGSSLASMGNHGHSGTAYFVLFLFVSASFLGKASRGVQVLRYLQSLSTLTLNLAHFGARGKETRKVALCTPPDMPSVVCIPYPQPPHPSTPVLDHRPIIRYFHRGCKCSRERVRGCGRVGRPS